MNLFRLVTESEEQGTVQEVLGNFHSCFWRVGMGAKKAATCLLP